ncbi:Lectin BRA-3 [Amphibalanus amphitrite]|uniref:Lectin BRA-3 n=1 Tax=Amphibalanus amphitrite TaxID=1232801 RepID=A0A6A4WKK1_AMPAM|nr:C-type mannose receptor 2-like [Amphibalanus amphitrite]KAF0307936.1 Lectin BRA-3 [Amphibalanus amphitrite]
MSPFVSALLLFVSLSSTTASCPGTIASGLCFWLESFEAEHDAARIICDDAYPDSSLALVRDDASSAAVAAITTGRPALIGLDRRSSGEFEWVDHEPLEYANWAEGQPEDNLLDCVVANVDNVGGWAVASCSQTLPFVCSVPVGEA